MNDNNSLAHTTWNCCSLPRKTQKTDKQNTKNPPEKKLPGGFKTYLNGFIMPF